MGRLVKNVSGSCLVIGFEVLVPGMFNLEFYILLCIQS